MLFSALLKTNVTVSMKSFVFVPRKVSEFVITNLVLV